PSELPVQKSEHIADLKLKGDVRYQDITFAYPTRMDLVVLKGINIDIKAGQKIALVGQSGGGKSTIIQLLMKFYNPDSGNILVDGVDIDEYNLTQFRKNIGIVPQEVILFGGTIRENIAYGKPNATEEEITMAARQSNSWEFISSFPDGMDTIVGDRGIKLSGGQRQRIAIARAILKDPKILILDEATSSLDAESEKLVQEALDKLMQNRTSIIIAHRLSTIRDVDSIYVLENGKIIEKGSHAELIANEHGTYAALARLQFEYS
ncbi:MAG: ABC subfamily B transporter ATP-binding protein, partial [Saprospiraceae bacterium]